MATAVAPMKSVVAIDPGVTTGLAFRVGAGLERVIYTDEAKSDEEVIRLVHEFGADVIVFERFATSGRISTYGLVTVELVGMLRGYAQTMMLSVGKQVDLVRYVPQSRRSWQDTAKKHGCPSVHDKNTHAGRHEADALAHLLQYTWREERGQL